MILRYWYLWDAFYEYFRAAKDYLSGNQSNLQSCKCWAILSDKEVVTMGLECISVIDTYLKGFWVGAIENYFA